MAGHTTLGGQWLMLRRWSVRREGPVRGTAVSKARPHRPERTGGAYETLVSAS